jgi:hypothetical protein
MPDDIYSLGLELDPSNLLSGEAKATAAYRRLYASQSMIAGMSQTGRDAMDRLAYGMSQSAVASQKLSAQIYKGTAGFEGLAKGATGAAKATETVMKGLLALAAPVAGFLSVQKLIAVWHQAQEAAMQAERSQNRLAGVLRATGEQAGLSAEQINVFAERMRQTTFFDDEKVRDAAAALLSFRNISRDVFTKTIELSADLAEVTGTDLQSAVMTLAKALADPEEGLTMLQRSMRLLTQEEVKFVKETAESGNILQAQEFVLAKIEARIGGTAAGATGGMVGALHRLKSEWHEWLETVGETPGVLHSLEEGLAGFFQYRRETGELATMMGGKLPQSAAAAREAIEKLNRVQALLGSGTRRSDEMQKRYDAFRLTLQELVRDFDAVDAARRRFETMPQTRAGGPSRVQFLRIQTPTDAQEQALKQLEQQAYAATHTQLQALANQLRITNKDTEAYHRLQAAVATLLLGQVRQAQNQQIAGLQQEAETAELTALHLGRLDAELLKAETIYRDGRNVTVRLTDAQRDALRVAVERVEVQEMLNRLYEQEQAGTKQMEEAWKSFYDTLNDKGQELVDKQEDLRRKVFHTGGITAEQERQLRRAGAEAGESPEQIERRIKEFDALSRSIHEVDKETERAAKRAQFFEAMWKRAAENVQDAVAETVKYGLFGPEFEQAVNEEENVIKRFIGRVLLMIQDMVAQIAAQKVASWLFDLIGMGGVMHRGGIVGRSHTGRLATDEVPTILQRGELVVPRKEVGSVLTALSETDVDAPNTRRLLSTSRTGQRGRSITTASTTVSQVSYAPVVHFAPTIMTPNPQAMDIWWKQNRGRMAREMMETIRSNSMFAALIRGQP